jgi:hypothetical protein
VLSASVDKELAILIELLRELRRPDPDLELHIQLLRRLLGKEIAGVEDTPAG